MPGFVLESWDGEKVCTFCVEVLDSDSLPHLRISLLPAIGEPSVVMWEQLSEQDLFELWFLGDDLVACIESIKALRQISLAPSWSPPRDRHSSVAVRASCFMFDVVVEVGRKKRDRFKDLVVTTVTQYQAQELYNYLLKATVVRRCVREQAIESFGKELGELSRTKLAQYKHVFSDGG